MIHIVFYDSNTRLYNTIVRGYEMYADEFLPFIFPIMMYLFGGDHSFGSALKLFLVALLSGGFAFGIIGFNAGHHHPEVVHDGDPVR